MLPQCGHSFCANCLENWMLASKCFLGGFMRCPICKCKTELNFSNDLKDFFRSNEYLEYEGHFEIVCIVSHLIHKYIPNNPTLVKLCKSFKKEKRSIFGWKSNRNAKTATAVFKEIFKCAACKEPFDEQSRMLPKCLHTICLKCLRMSYKRSDQQFGIIWCPACWTCHTFRNVAQEQTRDLGENFEKSELKLNVEKSGPPVEKLGHTLPFDYVLHWLMENETVIKAQLDD